MHNWGDEDVDWSGIDEAARYIGLGLRKYFRVPVQDYKEKYGTVRVYCHFGWHQFHDITHPGYAFSRYPKWLWKLDCRFGRFLIAPLNVLVRPLHVWAYKSYYSAAIRKWPHLRLEILSGADYSELLGHEGVKEVCTGKNSYTIHIDWKEGDYKRPETTDEEYAIE